MIVNISVPTMTLSEAVAGGEVHPGLPFLRGYFIVQRRGVPDIAYLDVGHACLLLWHAA